MTLRTAPPFRADHVGSFLRPPELLAARDRFAKGGIAVSFHTAQGNVEFAPPVMKVTARVRHVKPIQVADFEFLKTVTKRTPKVTIPSPTMLHFRGGREAISRDAYP